MTLESKSTQLRVDNSKSELSPQQISFKEGGPWTNRSTLEKCLIIVVILLFILFVIFLVLFIVTKVSKDDEGDDQCTTFQCLENAAFVAIDLDTTADPCEDFYQFACGQWLERNPLTPGKSGVDRSTILQEELEKNVRDLLSHNDPNDIEAIQKTRTFYRSCENTGAMDNKGIAPLLRLLKPENSSLSNLFPTLTPNWVDQNMTLDQIVALVGEVGNLESNPFIKMGVDTDMKQSSVRVPYFTEATLLLPSRSYYLGQRDSGILQSYQQLYVDLMTHLGADHNTSLTDAVNVVDFEIQIAKITLPDELKGDNEKRYNKMTVQQLSERYPQFNWLGYLQRVFRPVGIDITLQEPVVVFALDYYDKIFDVVKNTNRRTLLNYCLWHFVYAFASMLDRKARQIQDTFSRSLTGQQRENERWETCVRSTTTLFPDQVGRLYAQHHFSPNSLTEMEKMVGNLKDAFKEMIKEADWMSERTKQAALQKVDAMVNHVGYPVLTLNDTYLNAKTADLKVTDDDYFENIMNLSQLNAKMATLSLRKPVNREEWPKSAADVNAFYNPSMNTINFQAGILHKPYFSDQFMDAMNYGAIGSVIGHEITHGFDTTGRAYDKYGNLNNWWQPEDLEHYKSRTECLVTQYNGFIEPELNKSLNGKLTLGENIADNGGLKEAFRAYRKLTETRGEEQRLPVLGYTPYQLFFISTARVWCSNYNKQRKEYLLAIDNHSLMRFRVIGMMQNSEEFARTFNCPVGSYMNPQRKCHVW